MKKWEKAPEALTARFTALLPRHPDAQPRKMFGYAACFVKGNFFIGLHESNVVVRLPDGLHLKFKELAGSPPFDPMGGRPMRGWFVVPKEVVASDARLGAFIAATFAEVQQLPAKGSAPKKPAAKKPARKPAAKKKR